MMNPKYIIHFPTKRRWREKSRIEYIESGLRALTEQLRHLQSPPLRCRPWVPGLAV